MENEWTDKRMDDFADRVDRFEANVDRRFDKVDARFDKVDARFDRFEAKIDAKLDRLTFTVWGAIAAAAVVKFLFG